MKIIPEDMKEGTIYDTSNFGKIEVVEYLGWDKVRVKFIETGYEATTRASHVRSGAVKDPMKRTVYGVGFIGVGVHSSGTGVGGIHSKQHVIWHNMFKRCYGGDYPSYSDCTVCDEWHNFQVFAEWYNNNLPLDGNKYDLDKDIKVKGNRVYHPDFCLFVSPFINKASAHAKTCYMTSPSGEDIEIYNARKFCRENNLNYSNFNSVSLGNRSKSQGWTKSNRMI